MCDLKGMTVNERLVRLGLADSFDRQIARRNKKAAIDVLLEAKFDLKQASETVNAIFANPGKYGY